MAVKTWKSEERKLRAAAASVEKANVKLAEVVEEASNAGMSYRQIAVQIGRSYEWVRLVLR